MMLYDVPNPKFHKTATKQERKFHTSENLFTLRPY